MLWAMRKCMLHMPNNNNTSKWINSQIQSELISDLCVIFVLGRVSGPSGVHLVVVVLFVCVFLHWLIGELHFRFCAIFATAFKRCRCTTNRSIVIVNEFVCANKSLEAFHTPHVERWNLTWTTSSGRTVERPPGTHYTTDNHIISTTASVQCEEFVFALTFLIAYEILVQCIDSACTLPHRRKRNFKSTGCYLCGQKDTDILCIFFYSNQFWEDTSRWFSVANFASEGSFKTHIFITLLK